MGMTAAVAAPLSGREMSVKVSGVFDDNSTFFSAVSPLFCFNCFYFGYSRSSVHSVFAGAIHSNRPRNKFRQFVCHNLFGNM